MARPFTSLTHEQFETLNTNLGETLKSDLSMPLKPNRLKHVTAKTLGFDSIQQCQAALSSQVNPFQRPMFDPDIIKAKLANTGLSGYPFTLVTGYVATFLLGFYGDPKLFAGLWSGYDPDDWDQLKYQDADWSGHAKLAESIVDQETEEFEQLALFSELVRATCAIYCLSQSDQYLLIDYMLTTAESSQESMPAVSVHDEWFDIWLDRLTRSKDFAVPVALLYRDSRREYLSNFGQIIEAYSKAFDEPYDGQLDTAFLYLNVGYLQEFLYPQFRRWSSGRAAKLLRFFIKVGDFLRVRDVDVDRQSSVSEKYLK